MEVDEKRLLHLQRRLEKVRAMAAEYGINVEAELAPLEQKLAVHMAAAQPATRYDRVGLARNNNRPLTLDYIKGIGTDFMELKGDRVFRDDPAIVGGWMTFNDSSVMALGHQKGRNMRENLLRNFGSPHPEGYRKAKRLMRLAEKFGRPVITFIDTQGAYPGIGAEERGQAEAIARNLSVMAGLRVPIVACVIGEGGSGGALGIGVADRVLMLENAIYSVISPEGCAAILWRSREHAAKAAEALKLTATDLERLSVIDEVIAEPTGGAHVDTKATLQAVGKALSRHLRELEPLTADELVEARREKFYAMGVWEER